MFAAGSGPIGGSVAQPTGTPHWLHYVGTPDIEATVQAAKSRGGSVTKEVTSIPNGGKYAVLTDPQGAAIAVYQSAQDAGKESAPKRGEFSWHELATSDWKAAIDFYSAVFGWEKMAEHDMTFDSRTKRGSRATRLATSFSLSAATSNALTPTSIATPSYNALSNLASSTPIERRIARLTRPSASASTKPTMSKPCIAAVSAA